MPPKSRKKAQRRTPSQRLPALPAGPGPALMAAPTGYKCTGCGKSFRTVDSLADHMAALVEKDKEPHGTWFSCEEPGCGWSFVTQQCLAAHTAQGLCRQPPQPLKQSLQLEQPPKQPKVPKQTLRTDYLERVFVPATTQEMIIEMKTRGTVNGVPLQPRVAAHEQLKRHVEDLPPNAGRRHCLLSNTGPRGSGKTTLMLQNLLDARDLGCVSFGVELNGQQPLAADDRQAIRVAGDVALSNASSACACWPTRADSTGCRTVVGRCTRRCSTARCGTRRSTARGP
jgi:hypothetical protein